MVTVTTEALNIVKKALQDFRTDIEGLAARSENKTETQLDQCRNAVKQTTGDVQKAETLVAQLTQTVARLEAEIAKMTKQLEQVQRRLPQIGNEVQSISSQLTQLRSRLSQLQAQLSGADGEAREQIQAQINSVQGQIHQCEQKKAQLEKEKSQLETQKSQLQSGLSSAKGEKAKSEAELARQKNRRDKLKDKLARLKTAFHRVEDKARAYVKAARTFENRAGASTQKSASAVDKCLTSIEAYLAVSLGSSSGGGDGSTGGGSTGGSTAGSDTGDAEEEIDFSCTMNTPSELAQIEEMEKNGDFETSAMETLNSIRGDNHPHLAEDSIVVDMPANTQRYELEDFAWQALLQEDGLNDLTAYDFIQQYEQYRREGRDPSGAELQANYRSNIIETTIEEIMDADPGISAQDARREAEQQIRGLAVLHNPDQVAGGSGENVHAAGSRSVNSAFGALWRHGRAEQLYQQVLEASAGMTEEQLRNVYLNVRMHVWDRHAPQ